jgi:small subunit ribosomal protein S17
MKAKVVKIIDKKTFKAVSTSYKKHPKYGKYITTYKNYLVDSMGKELSIDQEVEIVSSRPISKLKRWKIKN